MNTQKLITAAALLAWGGTSLAHDVSILDNAYITASASQVKNDIKRGFDDTSTAVGLAVGVEVLNNVNIEVGYDHFNDVGYHNSPTSNLSLSAKAISLGLKGTNSINESSNLIGRAGVLTWGAKVNGNEGGAVSTSDSGSGHYYGFGFDHYFNEHYSFEVTYTVNRIGSVKALNNIDMDALALGVTYSF